MPPSPGGPVWSSTSWRERASSSRIERDRAAVLRALDAEHEHAAARRCAARGASQPQPLSAEQLRRVDRPVERAAAQRVEAGDRAARAGEEVLSARSVTCPRTFAGWRRRRGGAAAQDLAEASEAVCGHRQPGRAAAAQHVCEAAAERAQLCGESRRATAPRVEAPRRGAADERGACERAQSRVLARAPVLDRRARDVAHASAGALGAHAFLPLLLVAAVLERGVERADALERRAADRHVGAPRELGVGVLLAQLERRDRRLLSAARTRRGALQARPHRPREDVDIRVLGRGAEQRGEPPGCGADVVVDEHDELACRAPHAGVARDVQPERAGMGLIFRAVSPGQRSRAGGLAGVVDYEHLGIGLGGRGGERRERDLEVGEACARRDHDRGRCHARQSRFARMVLFLHNRYRSTGGEERVVEDLQWLVREQLGEPAELLGRDSADLARSRAAVGLLRGGLDPEQVGRAVRELGARVVHAHNLHPSLGWRALAAARAAGARVVLHLHQYRLVCAIGVCFTRGEECTRCHGRDTRPGVRLNCRGSVPEALAYGASLALWQRRLLDQVDAVVVPSAFARERLRDLGAPLPWERVSVIAPPTRVPLDGPPAPCPEDGYALVVSRLSSEKGVDVAIDACRIAGIPLVVAGEGPERAALAARAGSAGTVRFLGHVSDAELASLRAGAALALAPSRSAETFGAAVAEAMAAGLPVAGSRVGALPELLEDDALVDAGDAEALAAAILRRAGDRAAGLRGRERIAQLCAPEVVGRSLAAVYDGRDASGVRS